MHPFSKVKKEYVVTIVKKKNSKQSKIAALSRSRVWVLQVLEVLSKSLFETSELFLFSDVARNITPIFDTREVKTSLCIL